MPTRASDATTRTATARRGVMRSRADTILHINPFAPVTPDRRAALDQEGHRLLKPVAPSAERTDISLTRRVPAKARQV